MSSNGQVLTVTQDGVLEGISVGVATITAQRNEVQSSVDIMVSPGETVIMNERIADIMTTSSYPLTGTAILRIDSVNHSLDFLEDFSTTSSLPGLYVYLTNNPNSLNNALEIGAVEKFNGAQTYSVPDTVQLFTYRYVLFYCKPFTVKVGDGALNP
jgi:electron transfer DM13